MSRTRALQAIRFTNGADLDSLRRRRHDVQVSVFALPVNDQRPSSAGLWPRYFPAARSNASRNRNSALLMIRPPGVLATVQLAWDNGKQDVRRIPRVVKHRLPRALPTRTRRLVLPR